MIETLQAGTPTENHRTQRQPGSPLATQTQRAAHQGTENLLPVRMASHTHEELPQCCGGG
eukprot:9212634-Pyramimonas_sp.AAC.1